MIRTAKVRKILAAAQWYANHFKETPCGTHIVEAMIVADGDNEGVQLMRKCGATTKSMLNTPLISRCLDIAPMLPVELSTEIREIDRRARKTSSHTAHCTVRSLLKVIMGSDSVNKLLTDMEVSTDKMYLSLSSTNRTRKHKYDQTPTLDKFSTDLTNEARSGQIDPVVGRETEIESLCNSLCRRNKSNVLLIGEPGVGKTAIVEGLAQRVVAGRVPEQLKDKRVITLDIASMVAGTKYRGDFEERIKGIINDTIKGGNIVLFIDEIHSIVGAGDSGKGTDAANILKPYLSRGKLQVIGSTTPKEEREIFSKDGALDRRFQRMFVEAPSEEQTYSILKGIKAKYEQFHDVVLPDDILRIIVKLATRYVQKSELPDKAIDVLDQTCSSKKLTPMTKMKKIDVYEKKMSQLKKKIKIAMENEGNDGLIQASEYMSELKDIQDKLEIAQAKAIVRKRHLIIDKDDVAAAVGKMTGIPVSDLTKGEMQKLRELPNKLRKHVIGQNEALDTVVKAIHRSRAGFKLPDQPIGTFLFMGPTGVGKTETAKTLAKIFFGSNDYLYKFDMSEYSEKYTVSKLLGSPPGYVGYEEGGEIVNVIKKHPYSILLFDEVEKAHPDIYDVFLQMMDEGIVTDKLGRKVSLSNTIIIMTSNIGSQFLVKDKKLGFGLSGNSKKDMKADVMAAMKNFFRPEFINRIGNIVVFNKLDKEALEGILDLRINEMNELMSITRSKTIEFTKSARDEIIRILLKEENANARPLARILRDKVENMIVEAIVDEKELDKHVIIDFKKDFLIKKTKKKKELVT